jgi:hypothetical protein
MGVSTRLKIEPPFHFSLARTNLASLRPPKEVYMKLIIFSAWMMSTLLTLGLATGKAVAQAGDVVVHAATVDITHFPGTEPIDQIDMTATFTNNEFAEHRKCEAADALTSQGVKVTVQQGLCNASTRKSNMTIPFFQPVSPTLALFEGLTKEGATADAVLHTLTKLSGTCGSYNVRLDAVNVNLAAVKRNPVAVTVTLPDGSSGCLSINNALIDQ